MTEDSDKPKYKEIAPFALVSQIGLTIVSCILIGLGVGLGIDHVLHDPAPIATLIGLLLGLAAGVYGVFRLVSSL